MLPKTSSFRRADPRHEIRKETLETFMSDYLILSRLTKIYPSPDGPDISSGVRPLHQEGEFVLPDRHSGCGKSTCLDDCRA